ncbi:acetate/propionate family kinase [Oleisolibacter albus]|uniref:acetate/propionate family kinase n=1 Tax=Oleisolibacter albus TaxID=2171757 RepID=UPI000DF1C033|nr:acetate kinase [Oleisolibacter albus]
MLHSPLILVINCGSSSLKYAVFAADSRDPLISGLAECLGAADARLHCKQNGVKTTTSLDGGGHEAAVEGLLAILSERGLLSGIGAVGHRVVHGGERFARSIRLDAEILTDIEAVSGLAPLHNPANLIGIRMAMAKLPWVPQVAVFDTAFHQTMPEEAYLYAIPRKLYDEHGVRRYGFHGTSHRFVAEEAVRLLQLDPADHGIVIAHLGNGASATAVLNGRSIDTTMGMTPLEGLVMGTRSGDVDPGILTYLATKLGWSAATIDHVLNKESGLLGLSGLSNDCRTLEAAAAEGHAGAKLALDVFVHRLAHHIGGLATTLPRLDAVVFTGGIGENSAFIRASTLQRLGPLGLDLDEAVNRDTVGGATGLISRSVRPAAVVIPTNEEWMIARDAAELAELLVH